tara:strand:- start:1609 stop:1845 length:237 start_codon:yes stop_codon:yes gene_type:complete
MCLGSSNTPATYQRPDPTIKYYNGNVFDPKPEPEPDPKVKKDNTSNNDNDNNNVVLTSGLTIPKSNLTIGYTENTTTV